MRVLQDAIQKTLVFCNIANFTDCLIIQIHDVAQNRSLFVFAIAFKIKILDALSVGDGRKRPIPSLLPSQNHYLKSYICMDTGKQAAKNQFQFLKQCFSIHKI